MQPWPMRRATAKDSLGLTKRSVSFKITPVILTETFQKSSATPDLLRTSKYIKFDVFPFFEDLVVPVCICTQEKMRKLMAGRRLEPTRLELVGMISSSVKSVGFKPIHPDTLIGLRCTVPCGTIGQIVS